MHVKISVRINNALVSVKKFQRKYIIRVNFYYREKCLISYNLKKMTSD